MQKIIPLFFLDKAGLGLSLKAMGEVYGLFGSLSLMIANKSAFPMTMYTICTAIMALSYLLFGAVSGFIEQIMGYFGFFFYIFIANIILVFITIKMMNTNDSH